jgi:hypothetical protein
VAIEFGCRSGRKMALMDAAYGNDSRLRAGVSELGMQRGGGSAQRYPRQGGPPDG